MFDRLTANARKSFKSARTETLRLGHHSIDTEHPLLGLLLMHEGVAWAALKQLGTNNDSVRMKLERRLCTGSFQVTHGILPFSLPCRSAIRLAMESMVVMNEPEVGTGDLLLGAVYELAGKFTVVAATDVCAAVVKASGNDDPDCRIAHQLDKSLQRLLAKEGQERG